MCLCCACVHSCVCLRGDKIALLFGYCWQKYPVLDNISMLADTTRLSLNMRYWPVSLPLWPQLERVFMIIIIIIKMISYSANDSSVAWFYSAAWGVSVSKNMLSKLAHPDIKSCEHTLKVTYKAHSQLHILILGHFRRIALIKIIPFLLIIHPLLVINCLKIHCYAFWLAASYKQKAWSVVGWGFCDPEMTILRMSSLFDITQSWK